MYRAILSVCLILLATTTVMAQGGKLYKIAEGQKYRAGRQGGALAANDAQSIVAYGAAGSKSDTDAISKLLQSKAVIILPQNTLIEILKIEPKSNSYPDGLVECRRSTGVIKDGKIEKEEGTVYMIPSLFKQIFVEPADEETRAAAEPEDMPLFRTWKSATGGFEVDAELVKVQTTAVRIKRLKDGKEIEVALDQLSAGDRQWLANVAKEEQSLLGTWRVTTTEYGGQEMPPPAGQEITITFAKDKFTMKSPAAPMPIEGTWKVDPAASPKAIDMSDPMMGFAMGIYELKGDTLKICQGMPDKKNRPGAMSTKLGDYGMLTLQRKK